MQDTSVSFGYQLDVPKANLQFKGTACINSHYHSDNPTACAYYLPNIGLFIDYRGKSKQLFVKTEHLLHLHTFQRDSLGQL